MKGPRKPHLPRRVIPPSGRESTPVRNEDPVAGTLRLWRGRLVSVIDTSDGSAHLDVLFPNPYGPGPRRLLTAVIQSAKERCDEEKVWADIVLGIRFRVGSGPDSGQAIEDGTKDMPGKEADGGK